MEAKFENRKKAGQMLAERLKENLFSRGSDQLWGREKPLLLALPRGGVPIAQEVAKVLQLPFSVLIVRKIGAPFEPELAIGAICETDDPVWNASLIGRLGLSSSQIQELVEKAKERIRKQISEFRSDQSLPPIEGKTVILIDDGLATGSTMEAAIHYLKKNGAEKTVVAIPVGAISSLLRIRSLADVAVAVIEPREFRSVGEWYQDFKQVSDEEVKRMLHSQKENTVDRKENIFFEVGDQRLPGTLILPPNPKALVLFVHGSGSSRKSPRNIQVAQTLNQSGLGTVLFDLLTEPESKNRALVFDIDLLTERLLLVSRSVRKIKGLENIPVAYFGASTGAAAALRAVAEETANLGVYAVVSRGGRPDLAGKNALSAVTVPTLLLVGSLDSEVLHLNRSAQKHLKQSELIEISGATHLFGEPGKLEEVAHRVDEWLQVQLKSSPRVKPTAQVKAQLASELAAQQINPQNSEPPGITGGAI